MSGQQQRAQDNSTCHWISSGMEKAKLDIDVPDHNLRAWADGKRILILERRVPRGMTT